MKKRWLLFAAFSFTAISYGQSQNYQDSVSHYFKKDDLSRAIFWSEKNVAYNKTLLPVNDSAYGASLNDLGLLYFKTGNYQKAETLYRQSMSIRKRWAGEQAPEFAGSLLNLSVLYQETGLYDEAEKLAKKAILIYEKNPGRESKIYATAITNLANVYVRLLNYRNADSLLALSLSTTKKISGAASEEYALALNSAGTLYFTLDNLPSAGQYFSTALNIYLKHPEYKQSDYAAVQLNLAQVYINTGNYLQAEPLITENISVYKNVYGAYSPLYAFSIASLGDLYFATARYTESEQCFKDAIAILKNRNDTTSITYSNFLARLGRLYYQTTDYKNALPVLKETLLLEEKNTGTLNITYVALLNMLASTYQKNGQDSIATIFLLQSLDIEKKMLLEKFDYLSEEELSAYARLRQEPVKSFFFPYQFSYYSDALLKSLYNNHLLFSGVTLQNTAGLSRLLEQSNDSSLLSTWNVYKKNRALLNKMHSLPLGKQITGIDSLDALANTQEKELLRHSAAYRSIKEKTNFTYEQVRHHLKPGEAAIEFKKVESLTLVPGDTAVYTFMLVRPEDTAIKLSYPFGEKQLQTALQSFAYKAAGTGAAGIAPPNHLLPGEAVFKLVWQKLEKYLDKTKTVYFSVDGLLNQLAFAAIPLGRDSLLCDKYNLVQLTSTRQLLTEKDSEKKITSIALFGGIDFNQQASVGQTTFTGEPDAYPFLENRGAKTAGFQFLPGTRAEINAIQSIMQKAGNKTIVLADKNASETAFRHLCSVNKSPGIIHFATHGFTLRDENPSMEKSNPLQRCGLVLAGGNNGWRGDGRSATDDGILTGLEISNCPLQNTTLAVLSACETGIGQFQGSEGVYGLQRALKLAGVNYIMASLWKVPDKETAAFMQIFYTGLSAGLGVRESFINTQKTMRKKYSPYFWAGFTLVQ